MIKTRRIIAGANRIAYNPTKEEYIEFVEHFLDGKYDTNKEVRPLLAGFRHTLLQFAKTSPEIFGESFDEKGQLSERNDTKLWNAANVTFGSHWFLKKRIARKNRHSSEQTYQQPLQTTFKCCQNQTRLLP